MTKRVLAGFLCLAVAPSALFAYTHVLRGSGNLVALKWLASSIPVRFQIHDQTGPDLPNVTDDSDPLAAVQRALEAWAAVSGMRFTVEMGSIGNAGRDRVNIITFADTPDNRSKFEMAGEAIGLALFFFDGNANLTEADVMFNPTKTFTTTATSQSELFEKDMFDVQSVATHEIGHAVGLDHTGVQSGTMWSITAFNQRTLDPDDVAGVRALYPAGGSNGSLTGFVRVGGSPALGAHVVAVHGDGFVISALTRPNGTYTIENLPPGFYTVYVEPLDGPHSSRPTDGCRTFGNMSSTGAFGGGNLTTGFVTTFFGGHAAPTVIAIDGGQTVTANFDIPAGTPALNPTRAGRASQTGFSLSAIPVDLRAGETRRVAVATDRLGQFAVAVLPTEGAGITISNVNEASTRCNAQSIPVYLFDVTVDADAVTGGRALIFSGNGEIAVLTGGIEIHGTDATPIPSATPTATPISPTVTFSPTHSSTRTATPTASGSPNTTPSECAGDCNNDAQVTVEELVRGVNIALGNFPLDTCPNFDIDKDGTIAISELVRAVASALGGC